MIEEFKDIPGYEGWYRISNFGQIQMFNSIDWIIVEPYSHTSGYNKVTLTKNEITVDYYIHRLVLESFIGRCPEGYLARHFPDKNPKNNRLDNLSWGTQEENMADRLMHRTSNTGERHGLSFLEEGDIIDMRKRYKNGVSQKELAEEYGITQPHVSKIINHVQWSHI